MEVTNSICVNSSNTSTFVSVFIRKADIQIHKNRCTSLGKMRPKPHSNPYLKKCDTFKNTVETFIKASDLKNSLNKISKENEKKYETWCREIFNIILFYIRQ